MKNNGAPSTSATNLLSLLRTGGGGLKLHLVGVGGIGMSALAQLLAYIGAEVSGSDRALDDPANSRIFNALTAGGILLFPQDGSYVDVVKSDALVCSTAIEPDNPDFQVAGESIPVIHRADMLSAAINFLNGRTTIAVAGSCGKTSVTAWLAETLFNLECDPLMVGGGLSNTFVSAKLAGNFRPGEGEYVVFEADESDKSLLQYSPDYAIILNIGADHYPKEELIPLFTEFLRRTRKGCVLSREVREMLGEAAIAHLRVTVFDDTVPPPPRFVSCEAYWTLDAYSPYSGDFSRFRETRAGTIESNLFAMSLPSPGRHTAANAMAVMAMVDMVNMVDALNDKSSNDKENSFIDWNATTEALSTFGGVWRRFDALGFDMNGAEVRDDYAHNVDKIASAIQTAHETASRVFAVFQPHGYKPLEFMREELFEKLECVLEEVDEFFFLPVFYAGGRTSFKPTAEEVAADFARCGRKNYTFFSTREDVAFFLQQNTLRTDMILVMGARDNSLSNFASKITCKKHMP